MHSTKHSSSSSLSPEIDECKFPSFNPTHKCTHDAVHAMFETTEKAFMDLTDRFPCKLSRDNEHILIACHFDGKKFLVGIYQNLKLQKLPTPGTCTAWAYYR